MSASRKMVDLEPAPLRNEDELAVARAALVRLFGRLDSTAQLSCLVSEGADADTRTAARLEAAGASELALGRYGKALTMIGGPACASSSSRGGKPDSGAMSDDDLDDADEAFDVSRGAELRAEMWEQRQMACLRRLGKWTEIGANCLSAAQLAGAGVGVRELGAGLLRAASQAVSGGATAVVPAGELYRGSTVHLLLGSAWRGVGHGQGLPSSSSSASAAAAEASLGGSSDSGPITVASLAASIMAAAQTDQAAGRWLRATAPMQAAMLRLAQGDAAGANGWLGAALDAGPRELSTAPQLAVSRRHDAIRELLVAGELSLALDAVSAAHRIAPLTGIRPRASAPPHGHSRPWLQPEGGSDQWLTLGMMPAGVVRALGVVDVRPPAPSFAVRAVEALVKQWAAPLPGADGDAEHSLSSHDARAVMAQAVAIAVRESASRGVGEGEAGRLEAEVFGAMEWGAVGGMAMLAARGLVAEAKALGVRGRNASKLAGDRVWVVRRIAGESEFFLRRALDAGNQTRLQSAVRGLLARMDRARDAWARSQHKTIAGGEHGERGSTEHTHPVLPSAAAVLRGSLAAEIALLPHSIEPERSAAGSRPSASGMPRSALGSGRAALLAEALQWLQTGCSLADPDFSAPARDSEDHEVGEEGTDGADEQAAAKRSRRRDLLPSRKLSGAPRIEPTAPVSAAERRSHLRLCAGDGATVLDVAEAHLRLAAFCSAMLSRAGMEGDSGAAAGSEEDAADSAVAEIRSAVSELCAAPGTAATPGAATQPGAAESMHGVLTAATVSSTIRACALGHSLAPLRLGSVLFRPSRGSPQSRAAATSALVSQAHSVPVAEWARWSPQATGALFAALQELPQPPIGTALPPRYLDDTPARAVRAISGILHAIATTFPQTLHTPMRVTFDETIGHSIAIEGQSRWPGAVPQLGAVLGPLWQRLRHPTLEAMTEALDQLTPAAVRLADDLKQLRTWMQGVSADAGSGKGTLGAGSATAAEASRRMARALLRVYGERPTALQPSEDNQLFARGTLDEVLDKLAPDVKSRCRARQEGRQLAGEASSSSAASAAQARTSRSSGASLAKTLLLPADVVGMDCSGWSFATVAEMYRAVNALQAQWEKEAHPAQRMGCTSEFRRSRDRHAGASGKQTLATLSSWLSGYNAAELPHSERLEMFDSAEVGGGWGALREQIAHPRQALSALQGPTGAVLGSGTGRAGSTWGFQASMPYEAAGASLRKRASSMTAVNPARGAAAEPMIGVVPGTSGRIPSLRVPGPEAAVGRVMITGFGSLVLTLASLRKPRRLTLNGSDERQRMVLVKSGEDLRLDQRIESVFGVINRAVAASGSSGDAPLPGEAALVTFGVMPLTPSLGVIEWVPHTEPLLSAVLSSDERKEQDKQAMAIQASWMSRFGKSTAGRDLQMYAGAYAKAKDEDARALYRCLTQVLERGSLREAAVASAPSAEALVAIRGRFGSSLAAISAAGWLLGIGDRHPQNILIGKRDWSLVAIDFGYAFGFGTSGLPIPELIPFRLSPSLMDMLSPLDPKALVSLRIAHVLDSLRQEPWREILADMLDVFVREPTVDWRLPAAGGAALQKHALASDAAAPASAPGTGRESFASSIGAATFEDDVIANASAVSEHAGGETPLELGLAALDDSKAREKIDVVRRKLALEPPERIFEAELRSNPHCRAAPKLLQGAIRVVVQAAQQDPLPRGYQAPLDVYVHKLVSIATDANLLARQWQGLRTFL